MPGNLRPPPPTGWIVTTEIRDGWSSTRIRVRLRLLALGAAAWQTITGRHVYLSTGCLHGDCGYCAAPAGKAGTKRPGECKWGDARCVHSCHRRA